MANEGQGNNTIYKVCKLRVAIFISFLSTCCWKASDFVSGMLKTWKSRKVFLLITRYHFNSSVQHSHAANNEYG